MIQRVNGTGPGEGCPEGKLAGTVIRETGPDTHAATHRRGNYQASPNSCLIPRNGIGSQSGRLLSS
jgi:hypothetical protein